MKELTVKLHSIAEDGLPPQVGSEGRVGFIFDGCIVSGWPLSPDEEGDLPWEADSDVGRVGRLYGVTHWIEFPVALWELEK